MIHDSPAGEPAADATPEKPPARYYGDYVRRLFLAGGALMLFTYPFFMDEIGIPVSLAVVCLLAIGILAGLQSPRWHWTASANTAVAVVVFCLLEYKAATYYASPAYAEAPAFFWISEVLALIFFFGIYFGMKSTRART